MQLHHPCHHLRNFTLPLLIHVDEATGNVLRFAKELARAVGANGRHKEATLGQPLPVTHHFAADIPHPRTIHINMPTGNALPNAHRGRG